MRTFFLGLPGQALRITSQRRWSGDEPAAGLTWGSLMCHAACGAEHHQSTIGHRRSHNPPSRLCGQRAGAQAH